MRSPSLSLRVQRERMLRLTLADLDVEFGPIVVARGDVILDHVFPHRAFLAGHEPGGADLHRLLTALDLGPVLAMNDFAGIRAERLLLREEHDVALRDRR